MSRSYKKPYLPYAFGRTKKDKVICNRIFRARSKFTIYQDDEVILPFKQRECLDRWLFASDGKPTYMGKDIRYRFPDKRRRKDGLLRK